MKSLCVLFALTVLLSCGEFEDKTLNQPPVITSVQAPSFVSANDTIFVRAHDPEGDSISIGADVLTAGATAVSDAFTRTFTDDGLNGDLLAGDSIFTAVINRAVLLAQSTSSFDFVLTPSEQGVNAGDPVTVTVLQNPASGHPPVIGNLQAPDTLQLDADTVTFLVTVDVSDPEGLSDIRTVYFLSTGGSVIDLFDDGNAGNGDNTANDGTYSRILILPPTTTPGEYPFTMRAVDFTNLVSNLIDFTLVVLPAAGLDKNSSTTHGEIEGRSR
jgi:hypothetical protein